MDNQDALKNIFGRLSDNDIEIAGLKAEMSNVKGMLREISADLKGFAAQVTRGPDMQAMAAWSAVVVAVVVALIGGLGTLAIWPLRDEVKTLNEERVANAARMATLEERSGWLIETSFGRVARTQYGPTARNSP